MKFFYPLALALAAVVAAQDDNCDAAPIVEACLTSETAKVNDCAPTDYDCMCAAKQAVATCYNNCPKDSRASPAQSEVKIYCQQASLYGSAAQRSKTETAAQATHSGVASASATPTPTATGGDAASSATSSASASSTANMGVGQLARNTGGVLLAVAGVVAAVL